MLKSDLKMKIKYKKNSISSFFVTNGEKKINKKHLFSLMIYEYVLSKFL